MTTTGNNNTFLGPFAGYGNTTGDFNVAAGNSALYLTTTSEGNVAIGRNTGEDFDNGNNNVFLGSHADANAAGFFRSVAVGYESTVTASNQVRLGSPTTSSIGGYQAWTNISDGRYKTDVRQDVPGLDFILQLEPVTYQLNVPMLHARLGIIPTETDEEALVAATTQVRTGFLAQEVEAAAQAIGYEFSGIDVPKNDGDMYGLRYAEFVMPLIKAIQEQQEELSMLETLNAELKARIAELSESR
jgi:hypothetical protein